MADTDLGAEALGDREKGGKGDDRRFEELCAEVLQKFHNAMKTAQSWPFPLPQGGG